MAVPRITINHPGQGRGLYPNTLVDQVDALTAAVGELEDDVSVPTAIADDLDALHSLAAQVTPLLALAGVEANLAGLAPVANQATPASDASAAAVRSALITLIDAMKTAGLMVADA